MKAIVALIQMKVAGSKRENLQAAAQAIRTCARQGAHFALLPEMFCCPYQLELFQSFSEKRGGAVWQTLSDAAKENHIWVIGGSIPERDEQGALYNTCFVFDPTGTERGRYRKTHLFDVDIPGKINLRESSVLTLGREFLLVDTPLGKIGVAICFDLRFPELFRTLAEHGAQMIFVPSAFNMTTGPAHWELNCRSHALDNQVFLFGCAPARDPSSAYVSYGNSIAVSP